MAYTDQVVQLTKSGKGIVYISAAKVEEDLLNNETYQTSYYVPGSQQDTKPPERKFSDGHRYEHTFTVTGFIEAQTILGTDRTAKQAKDYFFSQILFKSGQLLLTYRTQVDSDYAATYRDGSAASGTYLKVVLKQIQCSDVTERADADGGGTLKYSVVVKLVRGLVR